MKFNSVEVEMSSGCGRWVLENALHPIAAAISCMFSFVWLVFEKDRWELLQTNALTKFGAAERIEPLTLKIVSK